MKKILLAIFLFVGTASTQAQVSTDTTSKNIDTALNFSFIFDGFLDSLLNDKPAQEIVINPVLQKKYLPDGLNVLLVLPKLSCLRKDQPSKNLKPIY
jgi:hypothetical protein